MTLTDDQIDQLNSCGIDPKTIEPIPEPEKPTIKKLPAPDPPTKKKESKWIVWLIIGIIIGVIFCILAVEFGISSKLMTVGNCSSYVEAAIISGGEEILRKITEEVTQCNQLPVEYLNYTYTLVSAECLNNLNLNGGEK
jgi:hypothetical protein